MRNILRTFCSILHARLPIETIVATMAGLGLIYWGVAEAQTPKPVPQQRQQQADRDAIERAQEPAPVSAPCSLANPTGLPVNSSIRTLSERLFTPRGDRCQQQAAACYSGVCSSWTTPTSCWDDLSPA